MSIDDTWQLIKNGRNARADWVGEQASLGSLAATMASMANSQGGTLLIGVVGQSASIVGVRDTENVIDRALQAALSTDPPLIIPLPRVLHLSSKAIVSVHIPQGMPHVYSVEGRYLYRQDVENVALPSRDLRRLIIERGEASFETEIVRGASLDDLDMERARAYVAGLSGIGETNVEQVLVKRGCLASQDGTMRPTNAGVLLFGKDPQLHSRNAEITAARFAGETMSDTFTRQDILGTLPDQIRRAEMFLVDHLRKGVQLGSTMAREESFEYPLEAARELVVNAVAHRDYTIKGDGIRLFLFSNRMEVTSPGGLPGPVTIANIKDERFSRNPAIVQVLSDMGFIERLGYGVDRVIDLMRQQKMREPEFTETAGGFRVIMHKEVEEQKAQMKPASPAIELKGEYNGMAVNPRQEVALAYLHNEGNMRITNSDLQQLCPDVHAETIRRDLADLVTKDILRKMGEKRGSYYTLKRE